MSKQIIDQILEIVRKDGPLTKEEVFRRTKHNSQYAYRALRSLVTRGDITQVNEKYVARREEDILNCRPNKYTLALDSNSAYIQACFKNQAPASWPESTTPEQIERLAERYLELALYFQSTLGKLEFTGEESKDKESAVAKLKAYIPIITRDLEELK